jgi:hypothetical protein
MLERFGMTNCAPVYIPMPSNGTALLRLSDGPKTSGEVNQMRYLKGTKTHGLRLGGQNISTVLMEAYADADWAGDQDDRTSRSGYLVQVNGLAVSYASKIQLTIALSSTEAERIAAHEAILDVIWFRKLLKEIAY